MSGTSARSLLISIRSFSMNRYQSGFFHWFLAFLILSVTACQRPDPLKQAVISGDLDETAGLTLRITRIDTAGFTLVDSLRTDNKGTFIFTFEPDQPGFYLLQSGTKTLSSLVIFPGDSVFISVKEGVASLRGGKEAGLYDQFRQELLRAEAVADSLGMMLSLARDLENYREVRQNTDSTWAKTLHDVRETAMSYLESHPDFLSQLQVINSKVQRTFIFDQVADSSWLYRVSDNLRLTFPGNIHAQAFANRVKGIRETNRAEMRAMGMMKKGSKAPDIALPDLSGKSKNLHGLKSRYRLVYFWAPDDALSRKTNPGLKQLYETFKPSGLEIFAVSLDRYPDRWRAAVNLDKLWWANVNDTLAGNSRVAREWLVQKLPLMILIDNQNQILGRYTSLNQLEAELNSGSRR
ncbi:MAG: TlpA family protein disulfide reductase [Bacteroidales bacterium]|nr:TlpA family protein disulfide reductase [Bacteroidales bacterium]